MSQTNAFQPVGFHLSPLTDEAWPPLIAHLKFGFASQLNIYRVMAHDAPLLKAWETLREHVVLQSALTPVQRELVILRIGFHWKSDYEWVHHVSRGRASGLSEAQIAAAASPLEQLPPDNPDRLLFAAVDSLLTQGALSSEITLALSRLTGTAGVIDLMATVGMYSTLAFIAKTFAVPLEPDLAPVNPPWRAASAPSG